MNTQVKTQVAEPNDLPTKFSKAALEKANLLMKTYAKCQEEKKRLQAMIAEQLKANDTEMKQAEEGLLLLGGRYKKAFDSKGNFELEDGYLHIAHNTVLATSKKFNPVDFAVTYPDMIDIKLKVAEVKKEWLSKDGNKELKALGVQVDTEEKMQVIVNKKI